jgi:hypothetical protein
VYELTDDWLRNLNEEFRREGRPHRGRAIEALYRWAEYSRKSVSWDNRDAQKISEWFEKSTIPGSQNTGSIFTGAFYFDMAFWKVTVQPGFGQFSFNPFECLALPDQLKLALSRDEELTYIALFADCFDYGYGASELIHNDESKTGFAHELLRSADQKLNAVIHLLFEERPNPTAIESARMTTEIFLKTFLAFKTGLTEKEAKDKIGHDLKKALKRCVEFDSKTELQNIESMLHCFPNVGDRYKGAEKTPGEINLAYEVAQITAAIVMRNLSGRDIRPSIKFH